MLLTEIFKFHDVAVSFEFYPPKTESGWERLFDNISSLVPLHPAYVSVTYGAGGTTRDRTHKLIARLRKETDLTVVAHLTCIGATRDTIGEILQHYSDIGVRNILALRGDPPDDRAAVEPPQSGLRYAADLVGFIKQEFPGMAVGVAGYPEGHPATPNRVEELDRLKEKVDRGADYIVTQLFFDNRDFYDFCERCELLGIDVPIIAGIMPITSLQNLRRMADLAAGSRFPAPLLRALALAQDDAEAIANVGIHWATEQVRDLVHNQVPGIHLYTLNNSNASVSICETLGLKTYRCLADAGETTIDWDEICPGHKKG